MDNYNYPPGADTPDAPWNQHDPEEIEVDVEVTLTIQKAVKVKVSDYELSCVEDEDGHEYYSPDTSRCDLRRAVKEQVVLPNELSKNVEYYIEAPARRIIANIISDCDNWEEIEMEVEEL